MLVSFFSVVKADEIKKIEFITESEYEIIDYDSYPLQEKLLIDNKYRNVYYTSKEGYYINEMGEKKKFLFKL